MSKKHKRQHGQPTRTYTMVNRFTTECPHCPEFRYKSGRENKVEVTKTMNILESDGRIHRIRYCKCLNCGVDFKRTETLPQNNS